MTLCCGMAWLSACQNAGEEVPESDKLYMSVVARIGDMDKKADSRYSGSTLTTVAFDDGDRIGMFINEKAAIAWNYEGLGWTTEEKVYWPDKTKMHHFRAYTLCQSATPAESYTAVPMPDLSSQNGTMADLDQYDFLVATTEQDYGTDGVVKFQGEGKSFHHVSSLIHLTVKGTEDLATSTLTRIVLEGTDIATASTYSFENGSVILQSSGEATQIATATDFSHEIGGKDADFYFILNSKEGEQEVTLTIDYTTKDDKTYTATSPLKVNSLAGGTKYNCSVTIKDSSLTVSGAEIEDWLTGEKIDDVVVDAEEKDNV